MFVIMIQVSFWQNYPRCLGTDQYHAVHVVVLLIRVSMVRTGIHVNLLVAPA
jgi:hypothetical protein